MAEQWTCPFCDHHQLFTEGNYQSSFMKFNIGKSTHGDTGMAYTAIRCVNPDCNEVDLSVRFVKAFARPTVCGR